MAEQFIYELLIVLTFGLAAGLICRQLRAPTLVGYLLAGGLLGQGALDWVSHDTHEIEYLAEAGVFLLLFSIGLEFSLEELLGMGRQLVVGGATQMMICSVPAGIALRWFGFEWPTAILLAAAVAFSSTVLVFKALSEAGLVATPHGRRAIGILLFQDAALVPLLLLTSILMGDPPTATDYLWLVAGTALFLLTVMILRYVLAEWLVPFLAAHRSPELVVLFSLVVLGAVTLFAHALGLPPAVGAFAAGLSLGGNRWSGQFDALLLPFRETFAAVFFVSLGLLFDLSRVIAEPWLMIAGLVALIALKALAASVALRLTRLDWRQSLGMGVGLAHVGEFAFVLLLAAYHADLVSSEITQRFVALGVGTLVLSPLLMNIGLKWSTPADRPTESNRARPRADNVPLGRALVVGLGPVGKAVASQLETTGYELTLIDRSPINAQTMAQLGVRVLAGDATDGALLEAARVEQFELIVICVPDDRVAVRVVAGVRERNPAAKVLVRCRYASTVAQLKRAGADMAVSEEATASLEMLARIQDLGRK